MSKRQGALFKIARRRGEPDANRKRASFGFSACLFFATALLLPAFGHAAKIVFVGDILMAHNMEAYIAKNGTDYPFVRLRSWIRAADIAFANLEGPLTKKPLLYPENEYSFHMKPACGAAVKRAGFDVVSIANNHSMDSGPAGLEDTIKNLKKQGIAFAGAGANAAAARRPAVLSVDGESFAFLAYSKTVPLSFQADGKNAGTAFPEDAVIQEDVARAKAKYDRVIVSFHWGIEYSTQVYDEQRVLAHVAVDSGADAVIGHHPHIVQGIEIYKSKIIVYSLGNFAFGTMNPGAQVGLLVYLTFPKGGPAAAEIVPLNVDNQRVRYQPQVLKGPEAAAFLKNLAGLSAEYGTTLFIKDGRAYLP